MSREAPPVAEAPGLAELWGTIRQVLADRTVRGFLFAYWLYIDGIGTLQQMAVDFGSKLGFPTSALIQALLLVQFISFPSALLFGRLGDRIGARRAILIGLAVFVFVSDLGPVPAVHLAVLCDGGDGGHRAGRRPVAVALLLHAH